MARLIDADDVYELFDKNGFARLHVADIDTIPTVDAVEVVHGRWEKQEPDEHGNRKPKCSVCGEYHLAWWSDYIHCNYCPNCGADMRYGDGNG